MNRKHLFLFSELKEIQKILLIKQQKKKLLRIFDKNDHSLY